MNDTHPYSKKKYQYDRKWKQDHPTAVQESKKKYDRTIRGRYVKLRVVARQRNLSMTLTLEEYTAIISSPCFYCGDPLPDVGYGLDRADNRYGYTLANARPCCQQCNRAKTDWSEESFYQWVQKVVKRRGF